MSIEQTQRVLTAYLEGHDETAVAETAVYTIMGSGFEVRGREAIGQFLNSFYTQIFDAGFEQQNVLVADGRAVIEGLVVGSHIADFAGVPASGKQVRVPLCVSYEMTDDQIVAARIYFETDALRLQVEET